MITFHLPHEKGVECADLGRCHAYMRSAVWIDLFQPTEQEEIILDMAFSIDLPTHREMQEIEISRRLYKENDALFMTATVLVKGASNQPESTAITLIFADARLITLRYAEPHPFVTFRAEREAELAKYDTGVRNLEGLIAALLERVTDLLEATGATLDRISHEIFHAHEPSAPAPAAGEPAAPARNLEQVLRRLGHSSDLISRIRESLGSMGRLISFFLASQRDLPPDLVEHLRTLHHDLAPLSDHASFMSQKVNFLLDATLGLINLEQNAIIKIFTIAAVLFLPPTIVGTIYGMNFEIIPELKWTWGYPFAIFMMICSAIAPYWYFKRRGWF